MLFIINNRLILDKNIPKLRFYLQGPSSNNKIYFTYIKVAIKNWTYIISYCLVFTKIIITITTKNISRYGIGDLIEANCTAVHTNPPVNLTWYINRALVSYLSIYLSLSPIISLFLLFISLFLLFIYLSLF